MIGFSFLESQAFLSKSVLASHLYAETPLSSVLLVLKFSIKSSYLVLFLLLNSKLPQVNEKGASLRKDIWFPKRHVGNN